MNAPQRRVLAAILSAGFVAGTLEIGAAALIYRVSPVIVLHAIAAGVLGPQASFYGGAPTATLGLVLQWAMSLLIAAIYVLAARRLSWLLQRWKLWGPLYGVVIFVVMNYAVVPLSRAGQGMPHFGLAELVENLLAMLLFGTIVAFFTQRLTRPATR
ncbi:MAG: hypothetical protein QJR02_10085 [Sinobacteraceae bacterium]|nr:hypothetical protein [Nevskiaceae bacterium]